VAADRLHRRLLLGILGLSMGGTPSALAHRTDEYLHAAFVGIRPVGVELQVSLTAGAAVAPAVLDEIDTNHDGQFSAVEQRRYAEFILGGLRLELDDTPITPRLESFRFPETAALRDGTGVVELKASVETSPMASGPHQLQLRNLHTNHAAVYLANALQPETGQIEIVRQTRDFTQSELRIQFAAHPVQAARAPVSPNSKRPWLPVAVMVILGLALVPALRARRRPLVRP
jgi:hypothetical protein